MQDREKRLFLQNTIELTAGPAGDFGHFCFDRKIHEHRERKRANVKDEDETEGG